MKPNQRIYNLAKARVKVASRQKLSSMENLTRLYQANIDLSVQRREKIRELIKRAKATKKPNWDRIEKLEQADKANAQNIVELNSLLKTLRK